MKKSYSAFLVLALIASLFVAAPSFGQNGRTVYLELLGASNGLGLNYDARFNRDASSGFGWRTGLGFGYRYSSTGVAYGFLSKEDGTLDMSHIYNQCFRASIPLEINYLLGKGPSKLDLGAGGIFCADLYTAKDGSKPRLAFGVTPYLGAGYRLVTEKSFVFRAGLISPLNFRAGEISWWPYIGIGKAF